MSLDLITDNWIFTQVGHSFANGLVDVQSKAFKVDLKRGKHAQVSVPLAGVQIETLLALLVDIVLRDRLIVDAQYTHHWEEHAHFFKVLRQKELLVYQKFVGLGQDFAEHKTWITQELCATPSLTKLNEENELHILEFDKPKDAYFDTGVSGTAAMLGRSLIAGTHYHPHPLRQRILEQTLFAPERRDVLKELNAHIDSERLRLFAGRAPNGTWTQAQLVLPPVAVDVIEASNSISDLVSTAIQLRDRYKPVREWLLEIQSGVDDGDPKSEAKFKRTLNAISKDLSHEIEHNDGGDISLDIGLGVPSLSIPIAAGKVGKRFGIRATLNKQVYSTRGEKSLLKLLKMFQSPNSKLGREVRTYLQQRFTITQ